MHIALPPVAAAPRSAASPRRTAPPVAAVLSLGAAWVHLAYAAAHFRQWWAYGVFFLATGAGQALFAPVILRWPRPALAAVGIVGNLAIVAMYVFSRTNGAPLGPHAHVIERVGSVDLATAAAEVLLICVLVSVLGTRARRRVADLLVVAGVCVWALRLSGHLP
jgi:hypothetical protein